LTLEQLSTFHVKRFRPPYLFTRPVSPHLAARDASVVIELSELLRYVASVCEGGPNGILIELAGGLFSPLAPQLTNADVARELDPTLTVLVAPDRLGVLHDVAATTRAAGADRVRIDGVILVAPETPDASTGTNAAELPMVVSAPVLAELGRAPMSALASSLERVVERLVSPRTPRPL
jgi:dethiobiotin synthetase